MADGIPYAPNTGATIAGTLATEQIPASTGPQYQAVKPKWGAKDSSATDIDVTSPLPAQLRDPSGADLTTGGSLKVTWSAGLPVTQSGSWSVTLTGALPLPTGAATAAKQPALGTAGVAATDVLTVQGIATMVAMP